MLLYSFPTGACGKEPHTIPQSLILPGYAADQRHTLFYWLFHRRGVALE